MFYSPGNFPLLLTGLQCINVESLFIRIALNEKDIQALFCFLT